MYKPKFFTLAEMLYSYTATKNGIDNVPTWDVVNNLLYLIEKVLDPTRKEFGKPLLVSSGFRCKELNALVGGVVNSQHLTGCAADIVCTDMQTLFALMRENPYIDQLLYEYKSNGTHWVHVSVNPKLGTNARHQIINNYKAK